MNIALLVGSILLVIAGLVHVYIFTLESLSWSKPKTWKTFGIATQADAETTKPLAYNQGWYNLFLAIGTIGGVVLGSTPRFIAVGFAIAIFAGLSMAAAALVLITSNRRLARAAALQGVAPLVGSILVIASGVFANSFGWISITQL